MRLSIPPLRSSLPRSSSLTRQWAPSNSVRAIPSSPHRISSPPSQASSARSALRRPCNTASPALRSSQMGSYILREEYSSYAPNFERPPSFAFAFDIDGVLLRSSEPIPGASHALQILHGSKIPFILLTNGGGKHESARVAELSKKLGVPLTEENFVQSHTPFKQLVEGSESAAGLKDKTILVTGGDGDKCRQVAEMYGFKSVVTPGDILMAHPNIWPFNQIFSEYYKSTHRPLPQSLDPENIENSLKVDAIFVFNDPRDWALDSQIILDLLLSKDGILGTYSSKNGDTSLPNNGWLQDGQPEVFFSNPDLFWATSYHMPRLGQGGFQAALQGVWDATTNGAELKKTIIGKPHAHTYDYAEKVLNKHRAQILSATNGQDEGLKTVYMVGDNPESDIRGANEFQSPTGVAWKSLLVKTGVYRESEVPKYKPTYIVKDVHAAVLTALALEIDKLQDPTGVLHKTIAQAEERSDGNKNYTNLASFSASRSGNHRL